MIADGRRMKEIGLDLWIAEQEARRARGFSYWDVQCHPYEGPTDQVKGGIREDRCHPKGLFACGCASRSSLVFCSSSGGTPEEEHPLAAASGWHRAKE